MLTPGASHDADAELLQTTDYIEWTFASVFLKENVLNIIKYNENIQIC